MIAHGQINPRLFIDYALIVRKVRKAVFAVIRAHSALAETAEAHFAGGEVYYDVVYATAAVTAMGSYVFFYLFIRREQIERGSGRKQIRV